MRMLRLGSVVLAGLVVGCADRPSISPTEAPSLGASGAAAQRYVLLAAASALPPDLAAAVQRAGGELTGRLDQIGVGFALSTDPGFADRAAGITGIQGVSPDLQVQWTPPNPDVVELSLSEQDLEPTSLGDAETFRHVQWVPDALSAPAAWDAGFRGAGARVAIVDGGIYDAHIDIAPNLDAAHSASFVPGQAYNTDVGTFWHGTHVAGIVAAAAQGRGTVGIAPEATIIGVKVLHNGSGSFSWVIQGIVYAATPISEGGAGADIINMSLGAMVPRTGETASLFTALSRATQYAVQRGATVVVAAGNEAADMDHAANVFFVPAQSTGVITVAATGPLGFALGATDFDRPASYTNYGQRGITFAAGGGDNAYQPTSQVCSVPRNPSGSVTQYCWVFDMVMAPCRGSGSSTSSYCWADGTSMASPAVAGVAALIVGKYGPTPPAQVLARLLQSADDLGKPGQDDFYGRGRVNAWRAVQ